MNQITPESVRSFLLARYAKRLAARKIDVSRVNDQFDLLMEGIVDSMGIMEMTSALEEFLGMEIDFEDLDANDITVVGPLTRYVAEKASRQSVT